jgi:hypothetical protein
MIVNSAIYHKSLIEPYIWDYSKVGHQSVDILSFAIVGINTTSSLSKNFNITQVINNGITISSEPSKNQTLTSLCGVGSTIKSNINKEVVCNKNYLSTVANIDSESSTEIIIP